MSIFIKKKKKKSGFGMAMLTAVADGLAASGRQTRLERERDAAERKLRRVERELGRSRRYDAVDALHARYDARNADIRLRGYAAQRLEDMAAVAIFTHTRSGLRDAARIVRECVSVSRMERKAQYAAPCRRSRDIIADVAADLRRL